MDVRSTSSDRWSLNPTPAKALVSVRVLLLSTEPPTNGHPLLELRRHDFILTPHVAWASRGAMRFLADQLVDNIEAWASGRPQNLVT